MRTGTELRRYSYNPEPEGERLTATSQTLLELAEERFGPLEQVEEDTQPILDFPHHRVGDDAPLGKKPFHGNGTHVLTLDKAQVL